MGNVFFDITIIIALASFLSIIFRLFKQPPILAYILTGIIIGPFGQFQLGSRDLMQVMGEFGITLLLFMLGLEMKIKDLKAIGPTVFIVGIVQIVFTQLLGYFMASSLGFSPISAFYISIALTFSSTIIIIKILSDKRDLKSLYGKISIGLLLVQDFFAILILVLLSGLKPNSAEIVSVQGLSLVVLKALFLFTFVIFLSKTIFPKFIHLIAKSEESLFLFSIAWVFGVAAIVSSRFIGFSVEIGGFLAGIALANSSENFQIIARMKALRDFFVTIFFVFLGMGMQILDLTSVIIPAVLFSFFVILIKPAITMIGISLMGYRKRTSFLTGINLAQVSEFSLIIIFLGNKLGHIPGSIVSLITAVVVITSVVSTYFIMHSNSLYRQFGKYLIFERRHSRNENIGSEELGDLKDHVVLIGANRMGESILNALQDLEKKMVVVDFDPDIVKELKNRGIVTIFGDIADLEIQDRANLNKADLVISTVADPEDNLILIKGLNHSNRQAKIIVMAQEAADAKDLYKAGADYVVLPHLSGGRHVAKILKDNKLDEISSFKAKDLDYLIT